MSVTFIDSNTYDIIETAMEEGGFVIKKPAWFTTCITQAYLKHSCSIEHTVYLYLEYSLFMNAHALKVTSYEKFKEDIIRQDFPNLLQERLN